MIICPKCKKELKDGSKFCDACGAKITDTIFCPNCGNKTSKESAFCEHCGTAIKKNVTAETKAEEKSQNKEKRNFDKLPKRFRFGAIAIVVVLLIVFVGKQFVGGGNQEYCLYLKDGQMVYDDYSKDGDYKLTSHLTDEVSASYFGPDQGYIVSRFVSFSENGKYVFYPDKYDEDVFTLYCRNVKKPKEEPIKIASDVTSYNVNKDGTKVIYLNEEGGLYSHDLKDSEKIASDVTEFYVDEDLEKVGFLKSDGGYYLHNKDNEKIASDIESIEHVSDDLSVIYNEKEEGLYRQSEDEEDPTKISSDICAVQNIYDSGEIYYTKEDTLELNLSDYVIDDMAEADQALTEPEYPDYPDYSDYDSDEEYDEAVEAYEDAWDEYDDASDLYYEKELRDELRESLQDSTIDVEVYSLYYYDGKESVALSKNLTSNSYYLSYAQDSPVIMYKEYNQDTSAGVKLSEIESTYEVENLVRENLESTAISYVAIGEQTSMLEQKNATQIQFSSDGKELFYVEDLADDEESGDLYKANISEKGVQKPEFVDEDVYPYLLRQVDNHLIYFKNYDSNNNRGDLWVDGKEVDSDVCGYKLYFNEGAIFYYSDWNEDKRNGTLKLYKKDKTTKIADDVYSCMLKEDSILYLHDFSWNSYTGSLFRYENGNSEKISDDVNCIIF